MVITGYLTEQDKTNSDYAYVPFEVPEGVARLEIAYSYDHRRDAADLRGAGNTIDIGIFDPRGAEFGAADSGAAPGFRGWSGSDRSGFFIAEDDATPGYLAGPIQAGRWQVILGLYHIATEGCHYTVTVEMTPAAPARASSRPIRSLTLPALSASVLCSQAGWYRGDLQCHTHHSDGKGSLATLLETAHRRGLDFLAVTDHNTTSHIFEFEHFAARPDDPRPLLLIPATEVTTYAGHMNVWGLSRWQEFRCSHGDADVMRQIIEAAHAQGALASVNHPKTDGPPWEYGTALPFDCMEIWQAPWPYYNEESLALWSDLLMQGRRVVGVGGSDYHQPLQAMEGNPHLLGHPTTWVYAESLSIHGILSSIARGRVCLSADVDGPRLILALDGSAGRYEMGQVVPTSADLPLTVQCRIEGGSALDDALLYIIADGMVIYETPVHHAEFALSHVLTMRPATHVRAEVRLRTPDLHPGAMLACSNPIFFQAAVV